MCYIYIIVIPFDFKSFDLWEWIKLISLNVIYFFWVSFRLFMGMAAWPQMVLDNEWVKSIIITV